MKHSTSNMKNCIRRFYPEKHFQQFKAYTGSEKIIKFSCWSCLLFENYKSLWNKFSFSDFNILHKAMKPHAMSKVHFPAHFREVFGNTINRNALDQQLEIGQQHQN